MEKCLAQLEESCRGKEAERVDLELQLTEVKENLKKSVASGGLGAPAETKPANKVCVLLALNTQRYEKSQTLCTTQIYRIFFFKLELEFAR